MKLGTNRVFPPSLLTIVFLLMSPLSVFAGDKANPTDQTVLSQLGVSPRPAKHQNFAADSEAPGWRKKELETAAKAGAAQAEWAWGMFWIDEHWHQNPITMGVAHDEPDQKKASEWLRKAQSAGFVQPLDVARVVQFFLVEGNRAEARFWLEQGALAGNTNCTRALITMLSAEPASPDHDRELARWNAKLNGDANTWASRQQQLENAEQQRQLEAYDHVQNGINDRNAAHNARVQAFSGVMDAVSQVVNTAAAQTQPDPIESAKNQALANINAAAAHDAQLKTQQQHPVSQPAPAAPKPYTPPVKPVQVATNDPAPAGPPPAVYVTPLSSQCLTINFYTYDRIEGDAIDNNCGQQVDLTVIFPNNKASGSIVLAPGRTNGLLGMSRAEYMANGGMPKLFACPYRSDAVGPDGHLLKSYNSEYSCMQWGATSKAQ